MKLFVFLIFFIIPYIVIGNLLGQSCMKIAKTKGHYESRYYWFGFVFLMFGFLPVIAIRDLNAEKERSEIISLLKDIRQLTKENQILKTNEKVKTDEKEENFKKDLNNTLQMKKWQNYIIQGRILKISKDTLKVAYNDNKNDVFEVRNYPTEKIIDEVWVKIKVGYLYSTKDSDSEIKVVEFIETVERY